MKVYNYVFLCITLVIILAIVGFPTGLDGILELIGLSITEGTTGTNSPFWKVVFGSAGIFTGLAVGGIIIGTFARRTVENFIIIGMVGTLGLFIDTFIQIINAAKNYDTWIFAIVMIIFTPLMAGFVLSLVEWFRGSD